MAGIENKLDGRDRVRSQGTGVIRRAYDLGSFKVCLVSVYYGIME